MKHLELIKLLYDNKELIDRAYKNEEIVNVDNKLTESTLFLKINKRYKLNRNYLNFADSILQRIDYSIIFGDYEKEYKELVKLKKSFIDTANEYYKISIEKLIINLYEKFFTRDREIQILLIKLENDTSLDIDILLLEADNILHKIYELIDANKKVGNFFRVDLRALDKSIDELLQSISVDILSYIQNIDQYINQINSFITQTKKRRLQNKQVLQLSNMIVKEDTNVVDEYLQLNSKTSYFTQIRSQKNRIEIFADDRDIPRLNKKVLKEILQNIVVKVARKSGAIKQQSCEKLDIIDIDKIIKDLKNKKSDDIFIFVKNHKELSSYNNDELIREAFKVYLHIATKEEVLFDNIFNEYSIKVAMWV